MANDYTQLSEDLFEAMSIIASEHLKTLEYNKTVKCYITNSDNAEKGEYIVSEDGETTFTAYSETKTYRVNNYVYVLIPNGDYTMQKTIIGKYVASDSEYYTYIKPSDTFVNITGDICEIAFKDEPIKLIANSSEKEKISKIIWTSDRLNLGEYNRLFISGEFKTWLGNYNILKGDYGLRLDVITQNKTTTQLDDEIKFYSYYLSNGEMYGNPYNFEEFSTQEQVIDISPIIKNENIIQLRIVFYQDENFESSEGKIIPNENQYNLFCKNPIISFGYALEDFTEDKILLYTLDSNYYATFLTENKKEQLGIDDSIGTNALNNYLNDYNKKNLHIKWIHKLDVDTNSVNSKKFQVIDNLYEMPENAVLHLYKYTVSEDVRSSIAGVFWQEIEEYKNVFNIENYIPDITESEIKLKSIIEYPGEETFDVGNDIYGYSMKFFYDLYQAYKEDEVTLFYNIKQLGLSLSPNDVHDIAEEYEEESIKFYGNRKLYSSEILNFINESKVPDKATVDLIRGLTLDVDKKGYRGIYRVYKNTGEIMSSSESVKKRVITATYTSLLTGDINLDKAESITWMIPLTNTMIYKPENGVEYDESSDIIEDKGDYLYITRNGVVSANLGEETEEIDTTQQYFRIKDYYSQSYTNNNIICRITKNNIIYEAVAELSFGPFGTNGTDYTLTLEFETKMPAVDIGGEVLVVPHIYDYEDNDITDLYDENQFEYSWYSENENRGMNFEKSEKYALIKIREDASISDCSYYILKLLIKNCASISNADGAEKNIILSAFMPIPIRKNPMYIAFDGADRIAYNASGVSPDYYKNNYSIYIYDINKTKKVESATWEMSFGDDTKEAFGGKKFYPSVSREGKLTVPSIFIQNNGTQIAVNGYIDGDLVWSQPIYIYQYVYDSALLNSWSGDLTIDEKNGTILSAMIGAGKKDYENRFEGVLMGNVEKAGDSLSDIGIYGYNAGAQSFGFKIDGTAFIGKSNKGQILFDGNSGRIQSLSYTQNSLGMLIDLDDGKIDILGAKSNDVANTSNSTPSYNSTGSHISISAINPYLKIVTENGKEIMRIGTDNYFLQSENWNGSKGSKFDIANGNLKFFDAGGSGGYVQMRGDSSDYFHVYSGENTLIHISSGNYYLQSNNYYDDKNSGLRIDMNNGNLTAKKGQGKVFISGNENAYFNIISSTGNPLVYVSDSDIMIKSDGYQDGAESGVLLTLNATSPGLYAYGNFTLNAMRKEDNSTISISTSNELYPLTIYGPKGQFSVGWDGSLITSLFMIMSDGSIKMGEYFYINADGSGYLSGWNFDKQYWSSKNGSIILDGLNGKIYSAFNEKLFCLSPGAGGKNYLGGWKFTENSIESENDGEAFTYLGANGQCIFATPNGTEFRIDGNHDNPYATGLNIGSEGIKCDNSGIECTNIGAPPETTFEIRGTSKTTDSFSVGAGTFNCLNATARFSKSTDIYIDTKTLREYVMDMIETYKASGKIEYPESKDGGVMDISLSLSQ